MRKIIIFTCAIIVAIALFIYGPGNITADIIRLKNSSLQKKGITLRMNHTAPGLYPALFIIPFSHNLAFISRRRVDIDAINCFTTGNNNKSERGIRGTSNFLDPKSRFKDSWFGVYIIFDDVHFKGRRFMLKDPYRDPAEGANIKESSILRLPELDQKIILYTTHQGHKGFSRDDFETGFFFHLHPGTKPEKKIISDRAGRRWVSITGRFDTLSALSDIHRTAMKRFSSIRGYTGLPDTAVYKMVSPWHPVTLTGRVLARYFSCGETKFWAVVYYNGSAFTMKDGTRVDTWRDTAIKDEFERMFQGLEIGCVK